jgi:hypothetical protein
MFFYVETPTDKLVYGENELSAVDAAKKALRAARVVQFRTFLDNRPNFKPSQLSGAPLAAWNAVKAALATAGSAEVLTHVVQRGLQADGRTPKQIALATATCIAAWDGTAPNVTTLLGSLPAGGIPFMGWPQTDVLPDAVDPPTPAQIDAANTAAAARAAAQVQWRSDAQTQISQGIPAYQAWVAANPYPA